MVIVIEMVTVMGDANANVGNSNEGWKRVMGREGLGTMNDNGCKLAELCFAEQPSYWKNIIQTSKCSQIHMGVTKWKRQESD